MPTGPRSISRAAPSMLGVLLAAAMLVAGCGTTGDQTATPAGGPTAASGFPLGSFAKEVDDPDQGRIRIVWTFDADGRWSEVPIALDGQTINAPSVRGTYAVDGDRVTIATDFPHDWGTSHHAWRLDGDRLWTVFVSSDNPEDKDWFEALDSQPWVPVE